MFQDDERDEDPMFAGDEDEMRKTQNGFGQKNWKQGGKESNAIGGLKPQDDDSDEEGVDDEEDDDENIVDEDEEESDHNF